MNALGRIISSIRDMLANEGFSISPNAPIIPVEDSDYPINSQKYRAFEKASASVIPHAVVPNHLTYIRLAICISLLGYGRAIPYVHLTLLVVIGALSDFFDGAVARARNQKTRLGIVLDPLADKLFMVMILYVIIKKGEFNTGYVPWILAGESHVVLIPVVSFCYQLIGERNQGPPLEFEYRNRPSLPGKIKLHCYVHAILLILIGRVTHQDALSGLGERIFQFGICAAFIALAQYVIRWFRNPY